MRERIRNWRRRFKELQGTSWFRWLLPLATIAIALILNLLTALAVGPKRDFPFAFYYLVAVFVTAWLGGALPGALSCVLTMVGIPMLADPKFRWAKLDLVRLAIFIGVSMLVSAVAKAQRRIQQRLRETNQELDRRVAERTAELAKTVSLLQSEVDERRRTEAALRESEQRVDLTLDAAGIGRWDLDLATGAVTRSAEHDRIFGYEGLQPEWTYAKSLDHVPADDRPAVERALEEAIAGGESIELDTRIVRADGEQRWVWVHGKVLRDAGGKALSIIGSLHDVTSRKMARERLQIQLARLGLLDQITRSIGERQDLRSIFQAVIRSLEDNLPIDFGCICLCDPARTSLQVSCVGVHSESLATELAMTEHSAFPIDTNGLSHCVRGELVYEPDVALLDFPFPQRISRAGLRSLVAAPLQVADEIFGVVIVARKQAHGFASNDCEFLRQLSEHVALAAHQVRIREALQGAYDELSKSQQTVLQQERLRALGQMASGIAHDINNAISPVTLYTESLLETEPGLSSRARQYLETIRRAIDDVAETVSRMREFYRQQEPQLVLAPVDVGLLGQHVLDLTAPNWSDLALRRGATIRASAELASDLPAVLGIESEIREALINLVLNAVDAMPSGGELTIRARRSGGGDDKTPQVYVEVEDTGVGMDNDTRRQCLEPFFTTKGERGTGLGLAMVYGMAQRHQAQVEIDSVQGRGTIVRLVFPVPEGAIGTAEPEAAPLPLRGLRILVIDDDPLLTKSLRDTLQIDGHDVVTADGGNRGIEVFQRESSGTSPFSLVITDLGMPYTDGRRVANAIKAASPGTPLILLTGWGQRLIEEEEAPPNVDKVLSKPPKLGDLRRAMAECMERPAEARPDSIPCEMAK